MKYDIKNVNIRQCDHAGIQGDFNVGTEEHKSELSNSMMMSNDRRAAANGQMSAQQLARVPPHIQDIISNLNSRIVESALGSQISPKRKRGAI